MDHPNLMLSGIYAITHEPSGLYYVGSAKRIGRRWAVHRCELKRGDHHSARMQALWNRDGANAFTFSILEFIDGHDALLAREQHWLDALCPSDPAKGLNALPYAHSTRGRQLSAEAREKIGAASRGRTLSADHRAKISAAGKGLKRSPETLARMSAANKGKTMSAKARAKMSAAAKGRKYSPETVAKRAAAITGRPRSAETLRKMSEARKGRPSTDGARAALRAAWERRRITAKPYKHTEETKRKQSVARKAYLENKREARNQENLALTTQGND